MPYDAQRYFPAPRKRDPTPPVYPKQIDEPTQEALHEELKDEQDRTARAPGYPPARERPMGAYPSVVQKFQRYEEISGDAGTGGTFILLGQFSGTPDNIDLMATGGDALVKLTDDVGREESAIRVISGTTRKTNLSRRRVTATNVNDGSQATVRATGKWAEPYPGPGA